MDGFCFKVINTVKIEINGKRLPKDHEIVGFLKNSEIKTSDIIGFYRSFNENAFFVKFADQVNLDEYTEQLNNTKNICIDGELFSATTKKFGSIITEIHLQNLPFEISDELVSNKMSKYGDILEIKWQKYEISDNQFIYNGVRSVTMKLDKFVPPVIYMMDIKVRASYKFQHEMCYQCLSLDHNKQSCSYTNNVEKRNTTDQVERNKILEDNNLSKELDEVKTEKRKKIRKRRNRKRDRKIEPILPVENLESALVDQKHIEDDKMKYEIVGENKYRKKTYDEEMERLVSYFQEGKLDHLVDKMHRKFK